ncbi:MAG: phosphatase PAP2 family protein [Phycisphaeraceae bacterium]|nr:phosphatase PAP2 family protein [Phycisphaerales bacterium]MCB9860140.1 phosphatase PAP2 family protein [Phycisphaeraceae bacterium]
MASQLNTTSPCTRALASTGPGTLRERQHSRLRWVLVIAGAVFVLLRLADASIVRLAHNPEYHRNGLHTVLWSLGRMETWIIFCAVALLCINRFGDVLKREVAYRLRGIVLGAFLSAGIAGLVAELIKRLIGRERPVVTYNIEQAGFEVVTRYKPFLHGLTDDSNLGFPSSHAAVIAGASLLIAAQIPQARIWAVIVIAMVCYQRLASSAHFPTDILGGVLIGALSAAYINSRIDALAPVGSD